MRGRHFFSARARPYASCMVRHDRLGPPIAVAKRIARSALIAAWSFTTGSATRETSRRLANSLAVSPHLAQYQRWPPSNASRNACRRGGGGIQPIGASDSTCCTVETPQPSCFAIPTMPRPSAWSLRISRFVVSVTVVRRPIWAHPPRLARAIALKRSEIVSHWWIRWKVALGLGIRSWPSMDQHFTYGIAEPGAVRLLEALERPSGSWPRPPASGRLPGVRRYPAESARIP